MPNSSFLVCLDTDKIKDYVFATNKLKEIRGASAILDELNQYITFNILQEKFGDGNYSYDGKSKNWIPNNNKADHINWEVIFMGGGSGKIIFTNECYAQEFCKIIQEKYWESTDNTASITAVTVLKKYGEDFQHWIYRGEKELRKRKDAKSIRCPPFTSQYFKICESTGLLPAEEISLDRIICKAVAKKRDRSKGDYSYFAQFKTWLEKHESEPAVKTSWLKVIQLPEDLSDIGNVSNGYIGFIYADGNRMGQRLSELGSPDKYKKLSEKIKHGIKDALFHALAKHLKLTNLNDEKRGYMPFEILLIGGDDLMVVVPADKAIEIAIDFCDEFKKETGVSICAGVVITHAKYPVYRMMDHAEGLLKSAKTLSNRRYIEAKNADKPEECYEVNAIDYMVLKGALLQELNEMRQKELSYVPDSRVGSIKLYQRPYTTEDLRELIKWVKEFKSSRFPNNKLKSMYESLYRGKAQAMLDYLLMISRLPKSDNGNKSPRDVILDFKCKWKGGTKYIPWWKSNVVSYETPFIDLIEIYDFISE